MKYVFLAALAASAVMLAQGASAAGDAMKEGAKHMGKPAMMEKAKPADALKMKAPMGAPEKGIQGKVMDKATDKMQDKAMEKGKGMVMEKTKDKAKDAVFQSETPPRGTCFAGDFLCAMLLHVASTAYK
jgi:hypothetical protein